MSNRVSISYLLLCVVGVEGQVAWAASRIELTPFGEYRMHLPVLSRTHRSVVVELRSLELRMVYQKPLTPEFLVAKYTNDCLDRDAGFVKGFQNVIENEFRFLAAMNETGLAPNVYYLSEPILVGTDLGTKTLSTFVEKFPKECASSSVQFVLMDKVGSSLARYFLNPNRLLSEYIVEVLTVGVQLIRLVQNLHEFGIIHGDIHAGNVAFREHPLNNFGPERYLIGRDGLVFLDFEQAQFVPSRRVRIMQGNRILLSPWQLANHRLGFRDDVFRAIQTIADLLTGGSYLNGIEAVFKIREDRMRATAGIEFMENQHKAMAELEGHLDTMMRTLKLETPFISGMPPFLSGLSLANRLKIRLALNRDIRSLLRDLDSPNVVPDYDQIAHILARLISEIHPSTDL